MADISLVCMREDAWKADLLSEALARYGFTVCRSASVFEDFGGYAAVVVLLSPGASRSELVMQTAARAMDWGKLIPVFVNLCHLPDRLSGVAMHDLSAWDGRAEDAVVKAIAYHAQRLAGLTGRPQLAASQARAPSPQLYLDTPTAYLEPPQATPNYEYDYGAYDNAPPHGYEEPRYERPYIPPAPYFVAAAHNELDRRYVRPIEPSIAVSPNSDAARRRASMMERPSFAETPRGISIDHAPDEPDPRPRQRRPSSSLFTVVISAVALMGMAWVEEARTREVEILRATPAQATAILTTPAVIDTAAAPRERPAR